MADLSGLVSLITGAGSGIGRASALQMAASGSAIMCADIDGDAAKDTAAMIAEHGGTAGAIALDVSLEEAVIDALKQTVKDLGGLNVVFNNAGVGGGVGWDRTIEVNLTGVYNGLFHGAEMLSQRGGGVVINTASVAGLVGLTGSGAGARPTGASRSGRICRREAWSGWPDEAVCGDVWEARCACERSGAGVHFHADDRDDSERGRVPEVPGVDPPDGAAGAAGGGRGGGDVPGEPGGFVHHGRDPAGRWRIYGTISPHPPAPSPKSGRGGAMNRKVVNPEDSDD